MSCSESWDISRSRYPERTSVAFSKSAWLFCKDKSKSILEQKKEILFFFSPTEISTEIKSRISVNALVTCSEQQIERPEISSFNQKRICMSTSKS